MRHALLAMALAAVAMPASASAAAPRVEQMVVFRSGDVVTKHVRARQVSVGVEGRRCAAGDGTALAALVRSRIGALRLRDYGSCGSRPRDSASLFVRAIRGERNRGANGWVYKVGRRGASAGAADPSGPFGSGRLRSGQRVTWFYCRLVGAGCQRTLGLKAVAEGGGVRVTVRAYDDEGFPVPAVGATVRAGATTGVTGADGTVSLALAAGSHTLVAENDGLVPSFPERIALP
jgi:hypothetical protein